MMLRFDPSELAKWCRGKWSNVPTSPISGFTIDTRNLGAGQVFVALEGERDGHNFIDMAKAGGASGALVRRLGNATDFPQLVTESPLESLQRIARSHRNNFLGNVVGITGSCGKTSTKDMLSTFLGVENTLFTEGNFNNHLGVPLTLLGMDNEIHEYAVIEAGINQVGEMSTLRDMINPNLAIVTNIGSSHLEGLISEQIIAREKSMLMGATENLELVIFPEKCLKFEDFKRIRQKEETRSIVLINEEPDGKVPPNTAYFQFRTETNITGNPSALRLWRSGFPVLNLETIAMSKGMSSNLALAAVAALELGIQQDDFFERLPQYAPSALRGRVLQGRGRAYFVDCYNANPSSMVDSTTHFADLCEGKPKLFVLGGMEELGEKEEELHRKTGREVALGKSDLALMIGEKASWMAEGMLEAGNSPDQIMLLEDKEAARPVIEDFDGAVLFKGSRKSKLETLVPSWAV